MKSKEKEINNNKENNSCGKLNKNFFQENKLKNDIIIPQKIIINSNIPKISYIHERGSDYDPQYEKYIEYPEDGDGQNLDSDIKGKDSIKASGAQIANTIMGAGILSIPIIMRYLGLLLGIIFIIFLAFCTIYSVFILIRCHEITGKNGFSMLGKITMGKFGSILIKVIIIINNLGFCIAYFRIFGEVVQTIIQGWVSPESFWANNWHNFIYIIICSFIMFSFIFIKNLSALKKVAYMGVSVVLIFSLGLTLLFIHKGIHHYLDSNISWKFLKPNCSFSEAFHVIPSVFLAFLFQFNVFPIYLSLKEKNLETMMKATKIGVGYSLFIFLIVGIVGFLLYGLNMNDTLLNNFSDDMTKFRDISGFIKFLIIIISVSFVTTCLTSFPILYLSLRENFVNSLIFCMKNMNIKEKKDNNKNFISEKGLLIITVALYILIIVMAIVLPKLKTIFSIVGATAGTFIAFILPNLFYIRICKISKKNYNLFLPMFFLGLGIFFLFISFIVSFI
jgi:amino acid permease